MSDNTPSAQPGATGSSYGGTPVPPAPPYPGYSAQAQPQQAQPAPSYPQQSYPAQPPRGPYGYAPGHVTPSPYAPPQGQPHASSPYAVPVRPTNGVAVAAMICGIVGLLFSPGILAFLVPILIPIAAVVLGHIALSQLKRTPGTGGKGMAVTGLILGYIPLAVSLLGVIILVIITASIGAFTLPFVFTS